MTRETQNLLRRAELENQMYGFVSASTEARLVEVGYLIEPNYYDYDSEES